MTADEERQVFGGFCRAILLALALVVIILLFTASQCTGIDCLLVGAWTICVLKFTHSWQSENEGTGSD